MSKPEVLIQAVVVEGLSYGQVAARYGVSKSLVHRLHHRWLEEGDTAFQPRSSRPISSPTRTPVEVTARILQLREELTAAGLDAGADTILAHLDRTGQTPSRATIWRILSRAGRVIPQPRKRPRSSFQRFTAEHPNQTWQSDFTHWALTNGQDTEIIGWLDDHARFLLHLPAHHRVSGKTVTDTFTAAATMHGFPASTLTDNGNVYTTNTPAAPAGGNRERVRNPPRPARHHPEERARLQAHHPGQDRTALADPEEILGRPSRCHDRGTANRPRRVPQLLQPAPPTPGAEPADPRLRLHTDPESRTNRPGDPSLWRVRYDTIDPGGKVSLRYGNRMLHLGVGREHARTEIIILIHNHDATVISLDGTILGNDRINPKQSYQPKVKTVEPTKPRVQLSTTS